MRGGGGGGRALQQSVQSGAEERCSVGWGKAERGGGEWSWGHRVGQGLGRDGEGG